MHFLAIAVLLCLLFPALGRLLGGFFKAIFWMILVLVAIGLFGALVHG